MEFGTENLFGAKSHNTRPPDEGKDAHLLEEEIRLLEVIAQRVGGDFNMKINIGKPGGGSFFNPAEGSITFDPIQVKDRPSFARFVAGHEGAHRAISPGPDKIGLSKADTQELYSQVGFGYLQNVIEDPAVNDWMTGRFPGLSEDEDKVYDEQFLQENAALITPEVQQVMQQLGYTPKFAQFGSEIIRDWHQGRFSKTLDADVKAALDKTIEASRESRTTIPDPLSRDRSEIITTAQTRFKINTGKVWPEMKKLVEMDLHTEDLRQMMNDLNQKQKQLQEKQQELKSTEKKNNGSRANELRQEIEQLKGELRPLEQMDDAMQQSIGEKIQEAIEHIKKTLRDQKKEHEDALKGKESEIDELKKDLEQLKQDMKSADSEEKKNIEEQIQKKKAELERMNTEKDQIDSKIDDLEKTKRNVEQDVNKPVPFDALSDEEKEALEKAFKKSSTEKKEEYRKNAKQQLEDVEDTMNDELSSKLNPDTQPRHHQESSSQESDHDDKEGTTDRTKSDQMLEELERMRKEKMTPYEVARSEVVTLIDDLYRRLRKILKPEESGEDEGGFPSGIQPDFSRIMPAEHDIEQKQKIWMREQDPTVRDFRFWHLLDVSGSMSENGRIDEALKGFIVAGEAIDRLETLNMAESKIRQGITAFHERVFPIKKSSQRFSKDVKDVLSTMPERTKDFDAGTNTYKATWQAYGELRKDLGSSGNFLLTFSDGEPQTDVEKLQKMLKETREERKKLKLKIGLIWIGSAMGAQEIRKLKKDFKYDFILSMPAVNPKENGTGGTKNFSEGFADLLEDIVKNPDKY